jgi:alkane 1-monooxygenase
MKKLKYLTIFLLPLTVSISFAQEGFAVFTPLIVFFVIVPLLELVMPYDADNLEGQERELAENDPFYNWILYAMVPLQVCYLVWFLLIMQQEQTSLETTGRILAMGIMCGVIGINVGHELGHRISRVEQFLGEILLMTSLENHFLPYHNRGHHTNVGTPQDPATARKNEPLYVFWMRSHFGSYFQAWSIEFQRMRIMKLPVLSLRNRMVGYVIAQIFAFALISYFFGLNGLIHFLIVSAIGIVLLETVNYIEHYGLMRKQRENGTYEPVKRMHSWNSNNIIGRVVLFELSRHSDHHFKADRPYQLLESHEESPMMPTGYPGMMILALVPPLFFWVMNKRIKT